MSFFSISTGFLIGGKTQHGDAAQRHRVVQKYSGAQLAEFPLASPSQVMAAIRSAFAAFPIYSQWSNEARSSLLHSLADSLQNHKSFFADLIMAEAGKPVSLARTEVDRGIFTLNLAAEEAMRIGGEVVPLGYGNAKDKIAFSLQFPIGPVSCITPFNFPLNLALHKIAPALAAGCSFVLKVPPQAPLTMLAFAQLLSDKGLPPGTANILLCSNEDAAPLVSDDSLKLLSFTGSDSVGWKLKSLAGKKKVVLELGGNAATIVDESAKLPEAAKSIAAAAFAYAGQVCISTQRIFVLESVWDEFLPLFLSETKNIKSGDPADSAVLNGPLIGAEHLNRIREWVAEATAQGAILLEGGNIFSESHSVFQPTVLTSTRRGMKVRDEEVFGPVVIIEKAKSQDEAIQMVNDSRFGLQASVFSNDFAFMKKCTTQILTGAVILNGVTSFRADSMPYGGIRDSGLGREGLRYAIADMCESRLIVY